MRGFKPKRASGANNYADGGVVSGIKRALGFDPERAARIAEYKAQQKAEAAAAAAPAAAPKLAGGALQNAANALRNRRKQIDEAAGYANGGMVRGPGTGTSDDIETEIPAGSYIMPADSTAQLGEEALSSMGRGFKPGRNADCSDIQWWLEWYTDTGATVTTATVAVTYNDGTTGNLTGVSLAATRRASFMQPLNGLIPAASGGKFIRAVNTVTLSASTGTVGNFGVTATRLRGSLFMPIANAKFSADWANLPINTIPNSACPFIVVITSTTSTGTLRGGGKIAHG